MLKHQAISVHSTDQSFIALDKFRTKIVSIVIVNNMRKWNLFLKNKTQLFIC